MDFDLDRIPAAADLTGLVERHFAVTWDLPPGQLSSITRLPHPCVNLVYHDGRLAVTGVGRERVTYPLAGRGLVFGVTFRPGGFAPFLDADVADLTGRTVPAERVWGAGAAELTRALAAAGDVPEMVDVTEAFLRRHWPEPRCFRSGSQAAPLNFRSGSQAAPDQDTELVGRIVRVLMRDRSISRVEDVCARYGMSPRSLQRLFHRYIGVSPQWVFQRGRLHEAAARLAELPGSAAEIAADLGYVDQSRFVDDFTTAVGLTPEQYAAAYAEGRAPVPM